MQVLGAITGKGAAPCTPEAAYQAAAVLRHLSDQLSRQALSYTDVEALAPMQASCVFTCAVVLVCCLALRPA